MFSKQIRIITLVIVITLMLLIVCSCDRALPTGTIFGRVVCGEKDVPLSDVMVVLCKVNEDGLPQEWVMVKSKQPAELGTIGTLLGNYSTRTDDQGYFKLEGVPQDNYLIIIHLQPDELDNSGVTWDGVNVTQAVQIKGELLPSGQSDFWETGGGVMGICCYSAAEDVFNLLYGDAVSYKYGFRLLIANGHPSPIVNVKPDQTVEVEVVSYGLR